MWYRPSIFIILQLAECKWSTINFVTNLTIKWQNESIGVLGPNVGAVFYEPVYKMFYSRIKRCDISKSAIIDFSYCIYFHTWPVSHIFFIYMFQDYTQLFGGFKSYVYIFENTYWPKCGPFTFIRVNALCRPFKQKDKNVHADRVHSIYYILWIVSGDDLLRHVKELK